MPELPEVETISRQVRPRLKGRRVTSFRTYWPKNCLPNPSAVKRGVIDRVVETVGRRGKFITLQFSDRAALLVHLRMSGRLEWAGDEDRESLYVRAVWTLDSGDELLFCDARKFGKILYASDLAAATAGLGVEPLSRQFTPRCLAGLLASRARQLKPLLLDQTVIAGLGNIYVDESLHRAGLHPLTAARSVTPEQATALHRAIRDVLRLAIRRHGTSLDWIYPDGWMQNSLRVYGRTGEPCRSCGAPIERLVVGQRGTHVCPVCQPRSDRRHRRRAG